MLRYDAASSSWFDEKMPNQAVMCTHTDTQTHRHTDTHKDTHSESVFEYDNSTRKHANDTEQETHVIENYNPAYNHLQREK